MDESSIFVWDRNIWKTLDVCKWIYYIDHWKLKRDWLDNQPGMKIWFPIEQLWFSSDRYVSFQGCYSPEKFHELKRFKESSSPNHHLGGGNSNMFWNFHPYLGQFFPIWLLHIFPNGLVKNHQPVIKLRGARFVCRLSCLPGLQLSSLGYRVSIHHPSRSKKHGHHRLEGGMWSSCQSSFFWKQREKWDLGNFLTEKISGKCMRHDFSELLSPCKIVLDCFSHGNGQVWSLHVTMSDMDMAMESRLKFVHHWAG